MAKPVFISPSEKGWRVQQGGRTISEHYTKDPARDSGRREAKKDHTELVEQNRHGLIVSKDSFGHESKRIDTEH